MGIFDEMHAPQVIAPRFDFIPSQVESCCCRGTEEGVETQAHSSSQTQAHCSEEKESSCAVEGEMMF